MTEFLYILAIIFSVVFISILLINIKYFFFKGEPLKKTCASAAGDNCACEAEGKSKKPSCENQLTASH